MKLERIYVVFDVRPSVEDIREILVLASPMGLYFLMLGTHKMDGPLAWEKLRPSLYTNPILAREDALARWAASGRAPPSFPLLQDYFTPMGVTWTNAWTDTTPDVLHA